MAPIDLFLGVLFDGLVMGCVYGLLGLGLSIIYGIMDLINFAHGEFYTLGGYAAFTFAYWLGLHPALSILMALAFTFLAGSAAEKVLVRPTLKWGTRYAIMSTFAFGLLMQNVFLAYFGPTIRMPPEPFAGSIPLLGTYYSTSRLYAASVSVIAILVTTIFLRRTMFGKAIRAASQDKEGAMVVGINVERVSMFSFGLGCCLAGIAGVVLTPLYQLTPMAGAILLGKAFAVVALGGLGSMKGAILAGMMLGVGENLGAVYIAANYREVYSFLILIIVILFRPKGLFGKQE